MKQFLSLSIALLISGILYSQEYKKDLRPQYLKDDGQNEYQARKINSLDILQSLSLLDVRINKIFFPAFEEEKKIVIAIDEFVNGEQINSRNIFTGNNKYFYSTDSVYTDDSPILFDYIDRMTLYSKKEGAKMILILSTYAGNSKVVFELKQDRENQFYNWRSFRTPNWNLNESVPLLVYASSWSEAEGVERFCGALDLSSDSNDTQELLDLSPHYYIINCTIMDE